MDEALVLEPGTVVAGKYRLSRLLGEGGMGSVYEAENTWTHRRVAVKFLKPEFASKSDMVHRFMNEAKASTKVEHPNIVEVLDMGQVPNSTALYIVQEFLQGTDLRGQLEEQGTFTVEQAWAIMEPVLSALAAAHDKDIVHRDLKPDNIFLCKSKSGEVTPKIIDFGVSKMLNPGSEPGAFQTRVGVTVGTPYYMSPEQARSTGEIDARSDIWAMGVVLFELLSGTVPLKAASVPLLIVKILSEDPPRLESVAPNVPTAIANVVHRALKRDVKDRFQTTREMLDALRVAVRASTAAGANTSGAFHASGGDVNGATMLAPEVSGRISAVSASTVPPTTVPPVATSTPVPMSTPAPADTTGSAFAKTSMATPAPVELTNTTTTSTAPSKSKSAVRGAIIGLLIAGLAMGGFVILTKKEGSATAAPSTPTAQPAPPTPPVAQTATPQPAANTAQAANTAPAANTAQPAVQPAAEVKPPTNVADNSGVADAGAPKVDTQLGATDAGAVSATNSAAKPPPTPRNRHRHSSPSVGDYIP